MHCQETLCLIHQWLAAFRLLQPIKVLVAWWCVQTQDETEKDIKIMFQFHLCNKHASGMSLKCW